MKKWILLVVLLLFVIGSATAVYYYQTIRSPLLEEKEKITQFVLANGAVTSISSINFYHGTEAYYVIEGQNAENESLIVWVSEDLQSVITRKAEDGWSKEQVTDFAIQELQPAKLISIRLGMEQELPVYEITYINEDDRLAYYYITFRDGTYIQQYSLRRE
ncbi:DUF5590 domain-containing protein [Bacillus alkalicellulosilyticus]|uniref:cell wall elongation regulator TseB-like domain-containing protein n=1 Tax=Alkalihalobacterium alkalicellulosilyticum TaxID=1912214 RepID=UPI000995DF93|nr:DUF5590 domain-containing protein [Bacillus alkalicellulosilyticus]